MNEKERQLAFEVFQERLWDDLSVRKPGDPPLNVPALMAELGVRGASFEAKKAAVIEWLKDNEPALVLREDLEDEGFI